MRFLATASLAAALVASAAYAGAAPAAPVAAAAEDNVLFAAGGTPLSNGLFFPGTVVILNGETYGEPMTIAKGTNITFVNADASPVANSHQVVSFEKKKRTGRPLFASPKVAGPGEATIRTQRLKPGTYEYFCPIHAGMYGAIEVVSE